MESAIKLFVAVQVTKWEKQWQQSAPLYFKNTTHFEQWCQKNEYDSSTFTTSHILIGLEYPDYSQGGAMPLVVQCGGGRPKEFYNFSRGLSLHDEKCKFEPDVIIKNDHRGGDGGKKEREKSRRMKEEEDDDGDIMGGCDPLQWT